jgi:repressor LexA
MQVNKSTNNFIGAEGYISTPSQIDADFAVVCKGDSLINARIFDGDIVLVRQQDSIESGEIAAVIVDGEVMLKRVQLFDDHILLEPQNPLYDPLSYWDKEMDDVHFLGVAVAFISQIKRG